MIRAIRLAGKSFGRVAMALSAPFRSVMGRMAMAAVTGAALTACVPAGGPLEGHGPGRSGTVRVALLVPSGSGNASDQVLADGLVNAARMAVADLSGVTIDLRIYATAGNPAEAHARALQAADEGAQIILGPVFAQEANAAGAAVAGRGLNVLAFSNNPDIAGGNVFILGQTFDTTARRLARFAVANGHGRIMVVHERNLAGEMGKDAILRATREAGGSVVATASYEFSQTGVTGAVPGIARSARESGASALFMTADTAGALPLLTQLLAESGIDRMMTRFIGLTRWDVPAQTLALPGVQGGWFALPDPDLYARFRARYEAAYGSAPHPIASLAYDGIAAIGALARQGRDLSAASLTQPAGFAGVAGIFRLRADGTCERGLAVAEIRNNQVVVIDPAPRSFAGAGL